MDGENGGADGAATLHDRVLAQVEERKQRAQPGHPATYMLALIVAGVVCLVEAS